MSMCTMLEPERADMKAPFVIAVSILAMVTLRAAEKPAYRTLTRSQLHDKIAGGWAGQMIGVSYRRSHRVPFNGKINAGPTAAVDGLTCVQLDRSRTTCTWT